MSFRGTVTLLGSILVVLFAAIVLGAIFTPGSGAQRAASSRLFPGLRPHAVTQVEISDAASRLLMRLEGAHSAAGGSDQNTPPNGRWQLDIGGAAYPASQARVDDFVIGMASLSRGTLVTRDGASASSLGLGKGAGRHVLLRGSSGEVLADITVGNAASGSSEMYVQPAGRKEVYLTAGSLSHALSTDRAYWAELRILPAEVTGDSIIRLSLEQKGTPQFAWTVTRERNVQKGVSWVREGAAGAKIQQDKLNSLAASVASFSGSDFLLDARLSPDPASAQARVTVTGSNNKTYTLLIGARQADARYPCALVGSAYAWLVPEWRVKEILRTERDFTSSSP
jgi:hypothetical protein